MPLNSHPGFYKMCRTPNRNQQGLSHLSQESQGKLRCCLLSGKHSGSFLQRSPCLFICGTLSRKDRTVFLPVPGHSLPVAFLSGKLLFPALNLCGFRQAGYTLPVGGGHVTQLIRASVTLAIVTVSVSNTRPKQNQL